MGMAKRVSRLVSLAFMPQLSSSYAFALLFLATGAPAVDLVIAILFSTVIEIVSLFAYVRVSKPDPDVGDINGRVLLFTIAITSYFMGFLALWGMDTPYIMTVLMLCYFVNTIVAAAVTKLLTKVSIHVWGISGPSITMLYAYGAAGFGAMLLLAACIGVARMRLHKHTLRQVVLSFALSLPVTALVVYVFGPAII